MIITGLLSLLFIACSGDSVQTPSDAPEHPEHSTFPSGDEEKPSDDQDEKLYSNPVWKNSSCADPSVLRVGDVFYCYSTDNNCNILRSEDLVNWEKVGTAFTKNTRPSWMLRDDGTKALLWAPCCAYVDGRYHLYYSVSKGIGQDASGVGVATSDSPEGPFVDHGPIVQRNDGCGTHGNIDQFYWEEDGVKYLIWGSHQGIFLSELTDDGLALKQPGSPDGITMIIGPGWEGPYLYKKNGYYYMFMSKGTCCSGEESTYNVQVGRSKTLMGPYRNKKGEDLLNVRGTFMMLAGNEYAVGPGHNAEIMTDDAGDEWFIYHSYVRGYATEYKRVLFIDKLTWDEEGWPVLNGGKGPSATAPAPKFN